MAGVTTKLEFNVDALVEATVEAALIEALGKNGTYLVQELVKRALESKKDHYSKTTILHESLAAAIQRVAKDRVAAWVADHEGEIKIMIDSVVRAQLTTEFVTKNVMKSFQKMEVSYLPFHDYDAEEVE